MVERLICQLLTSKKDILESLETLLNDKQIAVVTLGKDGSIFYHNHHLVKVDTYNVVDGEGNEYKYIDNVDQVLGVSEPTMDGYDFVGFSTTETDVSGVPSASKSSLILLGKFDPAWEVVVATESVLLVT